MSVTPDLSASGLGDPGATGPDASQSPSDARHERWPKVVAIVAGLGLAGFIAYAVTSASSHKTNPTVGVAVISKGKSAPLFTLPRLGGGSQVDLAGFRGKPTVVNFFASWCPDCRSELNAFGTVSSADKSKVNFVGVDSNDTNSALARKLLASAGATYPVGVDANGSIASESYVIVALPVTYFLDAKGRVVGETFGAESRSKLEQSVALLESGGSSSR
ncbi:MAG: Redoxin domain protein [Acidimicrobiaceae bacterium]|nr:Redoxin domain protein [Acidimicrobiaceae bacterium]